MEHYRDMINAAAIGALIGIGQVLDSPDALSFRAVLGRALCVSGLAVGSFALLALVPDLPPKAQLGAAAFVASIGTDTAVRIVHQLAIKKDQ